MLRSNLNLDILKQFNKEENLKELLKLTDQQWKSMLEDAW
jgi:hypothetical protein